MKDTLKTLSAVMALGSIICIPFVGVVVVVVMAVNKWIGGRTTCD